MKMRISNYFAACASLLVLNGCAHSMPPDLGAPGTARANDSNSPVLLAILLKHDETRSLSEIQENLTIHHFYERFPPAGTTVVNWPVVMGMGQLLVLETPAAQVAEVKKTLNEVSEGAFATEIFPAENEFPRVRERLLNRNKKTLETSPVAPGDMLLTIILRPIESRDPQATEKLAAERGLYDQFPPKGSTVVNWYEARGLGAVITLEFPATMLRDVNLTLERHAWKTYRTEFYPSYDFYAPARDSFGLRNHAKKSL